MKIYAMPADAYPGAVQDIQDWSRGIWGDDHIATIRGLASQVVGRDARIAELERQVEHWRPFFGNLEARARVNEDGDIAHVRSERDKALQRIQECEATIRERNAEIRDLRMLEPFLRASGDPDAIRERDAAHARADRYGRALKAAVELIP